MGDSTSSSDTNNLATLVLCGRPFPWLHQSSETEIGSVAGLTISWALPDNHLVGDAHHLESDFIAVENAGPGDIWFKPWRREVAAPKEWRGRLVKSGSYVLLGSPRGLRPTGACLLVRSLESAKVTVRRGAPVISK